MAFGPAEKSVSLSSTCGFCTRPAAAHDSRVVVRPLYHPLSERASACTRMRPADEDRRARTARARSRHRTRRPGAPVRRRAARPPSAPAASWAPPPARACADRQRRPDPCGCGDAAQQGGMAVPAMHAHGALVLPGGCAPDQAAVEQPREEGSALHGLSQPHVVP